MNGGAVLYVKHLERMRRFYRECFALRTVETTEAYCVLESAAWTLSLVVVPDGIAAAITRDPARARDDVPVKLAFDVPSIDDSAFLLTKLGGQIDPDVEQWDFRGLRHWSRLSTQKGTSFSCESRWPVRPETSGPACWRMLASVA